MELNEQTGLPRWLSAGSPDVSFLIDTAEDVAEQALDQWDEAHQGKKRTPGVRRFAVPVATSSRPIEGGLARARMLRHIAEGTKETDEDAMISMLDGSADLDIERHRPADGYDLKAYG